MLLIPSIDLRGGRCVRLLKGNFGAETRYEIDPLALTQRYRALGASWLHIVDLDGARDGAAGNRLAIQALANASEQPLQVGGGLRDQAAVADLLQHGVARAVIGSAAVEQPQQVANWLQQYGSDRICLAFDIKHDATGVPRVCTRGWVHATGISLWDAVERFVPQGLRHVLCTDIERDGVLAGPNLALYAQARHRFEGIQWQASGGVSSTADLQALAALGLSAAISGKALLEGLIPTEELKSFLRDA